MTVAFDGKGIVRPCGGGRDFAAAWLGYLKATADAFLKAGRTFPKPLRADHERACEAVAAALEQDQAKAYACFASPAIGAGLHCRLNRKNFKGFEASIDERFREVVPHLLFELAARDLLDAPVDWTHGAPPLASPRFGNRFTAANAMGWGFENGRITALTAKGPSGGADLKTGECEAPVKAETAFYPAGGLFKLALSDPNPVAAFEEHPDKGGNAASLGGRPLDEWLGSLERVTAWLNEYAPDFASEMGLLLRIFVPVGYDDLKHLSASYREAIGIVYLTLHPNDLVMMTALIHEFQHNKILAAAYSDQILENAFHPLYKSPVRPDPRPLWGILLAVHAFLPVALILRRMRTASDPKVPRGTLEDMIKDYDQKNHEGMEMLRANAKWTPFGKQIFAELDALDRAHQSAP